MQRVKYLKYGGVKFKPLVSTSKINSYVRSLPEQRRESMFEIAQELQSRGMIKIYEHEPLVSQGVDSCL